jgi:hypothetical protein
MKKMAVAACAAALVAPLWAGNAGATTIEYTLTDIGAPGTDYRYVFNVINDGSLGAAIEWFDIEFPGPNYLAGQPYNEGSLSIVTGNPPSADWDEQLLGYVSGLQPSTYDVFALGSGIADGTSQGGFAVEFIWLGAGTPGAQAFNIYDPDTFDVLETGTTVEATGPGPGPLPVPTPLALMGVGLGLLTAWRRR